MTKWLTTNDPYPFIARNLRVVFKNRILLALDQMVFKSKALFHLLSFLFGQNREQWVTCFRTFYGGVFDVILNLCNLVFKVAFCIT